MPTSIVEGVPAKALKNIEKLGYSRYRPYEVQEIWFEIRRFSYRRFKLGPGIQNGQDNDNGIVKLYAKEFLKAHASLFFTKAKQEWCPELTVYDSSASEADFWRAFKPLGDLIWTAKNDYKTPPRLLHIPYPKNMPTDHRPEQFLGPLADTNSPVTETSNSSTSILDSDQVASHKNLGNPIGCGGPPAKPSSTVADCLAIEHSDPASWDTATQFEPDAFLNKNASPGKGEEAALIIMRRLKFAFVTDDKVHFWRFGAQLDLSTWGHFVFQEFENEAMKWCPFQPGESREVEVRCVNNGELGPHRLRFRSKYSPFEYGLGYMQRFFGNALREWNRKLAKSPDDFLYLENHKFKKEL